MVAASPKPAGGDAQRCVDRVRVEQAELRQVQQRQLLVDPDDAHEVIDDLGHADGGQASGLACLQQVPNLSRCRFALEDACTA